MYCMKCSGRMFLDRIFSDNKNFEAYCVMCGDRKFVSKGTGLGQWLAQKEQRRMQARSLAN